MPGFRENVVVGIDVASEFSYMVILDPDGNKIEGRKFMHDVTSLQQVSDRIKEAEKLYSAPAKVVMESTGIYHMPLSCFFGDKGLEVLILNPIISHYSREVGIRKAKTDKKDAFSIADLVRNKDVRLSKPLPMELYLLRQQSREYAHLIDDRAAVKLRLGAALQQAIPGYSTVFPNITSVASIALLTAYPSVKIMQQASLEELTVLIAQHGRKGIEWGEKKAMALKDILQHMDQFQGLEKLMELTVPAHLAQLQTLNQQLKAVANSIKDTVESDSLTDEQKRNLALIKSIPGMGFLTAVTIFAEIGSFDSFSKPKQLVAFFGIDPSVSQSGKFNGTNMKMSKRGTRYGRRALYNLALQSVRTKRRKGGSVPVNPVIREYYQTKKTSKKNKVALGAVMHKLLNYVFAVLRNQKPFELRSAEEHKRRYLHHTPVASVA